MGYDVHHLKPWGMKITLYLLTKGIAAGAFFVAALARLMGADDALERGRAELEDEVDHVDQKGRGTIIGEPYRRGYRKIGRDVHHGRCSRSEVQAA